MIRQDLLDAGYRGYPPGCFRSADKLYQRTIKDGDKKAYFINVYFYKDRNDGLGEQCEAQTKLYLPGDRWLTLELHDAEKMTVAEMEAIFAAAWSKLGCLHDIHNNGVD